MLFACEREAEGAAASDESVMTEYSDNLSVTMSQNGRRSYHFATPLLEGYSLAKEPYREFRKGVKITTYKNDSLTTVDAVLTANYAIYFETRQLWEAKGNVVVEKSDGKTLYTQQLFWDQRTKKIYSNVDSKIVQSGGRDVFVGEGFESDEEFRDWRFRRMKGRMEVEVPPAGDADSARQAEAVPPGSAGTGAPGNGAPNGASPRTAAAPAGVSSPASSPAAAAPKGPVAPGSSTASGPSTAPNSSTASGSPAVPAVSPAAASSPRPDAGAAPSGRGPRRTPAAPRRSPASAPSQAEQAPLPLSADAPEAEPATSNSDSDRL